MTKVELFAKLTRWKVVNVINHELPEKVIRKIVHLIETKEEMNKKFAAAKELPNIGIITTKFKLGKYREALFGLRTIEGQIGQLLRENIDVHPNDCFHPTILQAKQLNGLPGRCLLCGHTYGL